MRDLDSALVLGALRATGDALGRRGPRPRVRLVVAGGTAGLLAGLLKASRTTADCDVMWEGDERTWSDIERAGGEVAAELGLPRTWLNRDCSMYAWCLPVGWQSRCKRVGTFGPLDVFRIARIDLIAAKIVSSPKRPQDLEDLRHIHPTAAELELVGKHLDRLESEHLDGAKFDDQRIVLKALRGGA